jgi:hypothetical protein
MLATKLLAIELGGNIPGIEVASKYENSDVSMPAHTTYQ